MPLERKAAFVIRGLQAWGIAILVSVLVFGIVGIHFNFEFVVVALAGPVMLTGFSGFELNSIILFVVSLFVFILLQRLPYPWLWCCEWLGFGLAFVFWVTGIMAIT